MLWNWCILSRIWISKWKWCQNRPYCFRSGKLLNSTLNGKQTDKQKSLFLNSISCLRSGFNPILKNLSAKSSWFEIKAWFLQIILSSIQPMGIYLDTVSKLMWLLQFFFLGTHSGKSLHRMGRKEERTVLNLMIL